VGDRGCHACPQKHLWCDQDRGGRPLRTLPTESPARVPHLLALGASPRSR
jgi:hypothetical protein